MIASLVTSFSPDQEPEAASAELVGLTQELMDSSRFSASLS